MGRHNQAFFMNETVSQNYPQETVAVEQPIAPTQPNKVRSITIREVHRGYIVEVGCHTFAFETKESMLSKITAYVNEPEATETKWFKGELF